MLHNNNNNNNNNNNKVQTGKGGQKRNVHSYYVYVVGANQPVPLVVTKQDFYQVIWDARRTTPPQASKKVSTPPTKKVKASSARAVSPQSVVPPSPPKSFNAINIMVQEAWKVAFPNLRFPVELIGVFPALPPEIHQEPTAWMRQPTNDSSNLKVTINKNLGTQFLKQRVFITGLKKTLNNNSSQPTQHTKHLLAVFAASHPQISVIYQELLIALACYTFLLEVEAFVEYSSKAKGMDLSFINLENVANSSPTVPCHLPIG
jgi:hypothetical protein